MNELDQSPRGLVSALLQGNKNVPPTLEIARTAWLARGITAHYRSPIASADSKRPPHPHPPSPTFCTPLSRRVAHLDIPVEVTAFANSLCLVRVVVHLNSPRMTTVRVAVAARNRCLCHLITRHSAYRTQPSSSERGA